MTLEEFDECILKWGSNLSAWPEVTRLEAETLLADSDAATALFEEMLLMSGTVDNAVMHGVPASIISAKVQASVIERVESGSILTLLPLKRILGLGSLAGASGGVVAAILPLTTGTSTLLSLALGGIMP